MMLLRKCQCLHKFRLDGRPIVILNTRRILTTKVLSSPLLLRQGVLETAVGLHFLDNVQSTEQFPVTV